jgi:hypothetical protein
MGSIVTNKPLEKTPDNGLSVSVLLRRAGVHNNAALVTNLNYLSGKVSFL